MQARLENWINGLERRLVRQPAALLRRAVPGLVSASLRGRHAATTRSRIAPSDDSRLPIDPSTDVPDGYRRRSSATCPGGFTRRPRHHGHLGDILAHAADRGAAGWRIRICSRACSRWTSRPQAHDIIRTWLFSTVLRSRARVRLAAVDARGDLRLGARSRPQEDVEVEGQRRHADGTARGARRRTACATGPPVAGQARTRPSTPAQMKVGAALADQAAQRVEVRSVSAPEPRGPVTAAVDRGLLTSLARLVRETTADLDGLTTRVCSNGRNPFFWSFCDDYLELVRRPSLRRSGFGLAASANGALMAALSTMLRLFARFPPVCQRKKCGRGGRTGPFIARPGRRRRKSLAACEPSREHGVGRAGAGVRQRRSRRHPQEEVGGAAAAQDPRGARRNPGAVGTAGAAE